MDSWLAGVIFGTVFGFLLGWAVIVVVVLWREGSNHRARAREELRRGWTADFVPDDWLDV